MKKLAVLTTLAIILAVAGPVYAGGFSLYGSWWDQGDAGSIGGWGLRLTRGDGGWLLDFSLGFFGNHTQVEDTATPWEGKLSVKPLEIGLRYTSPYPHTFRPYAGGGISYNFLDVSPGSVDNMWGWYAVGGLLIGNIRTIDFMVEVLYRGVNDTGITLKSCSGEALRGRVDLAGWALNAGVTIHL